MAKKFLVPIDIESYIDLNKNELRNAVVQNLSTAPSSPSDGQVYYDTDDDKLYLRADGAWEIVNRFTAADESKLDAIEAAADVTDATNVNAAGAVMETDFDATTFLYATSDNTPQPKTPAEVLTILGIETGATADQTAAQILALLLTVDGSGTSLDADKLDAQEGSHYLARGNHTGTQAASTISDFDTQVRTSRLDQMAAPSASVSANSQRITAVGSPSADTDAATKAYVDATKQGLNVKTPVRVASTANVAVANGLENGDTVDGVTIATGDRVLLKNQSTATENGVYVAVSSGAASRATDMDASSEAIGGAFVWVNEGTVNADTQYVITTNDPITLGSTSITWTQFSGSAQVTAGNGLDKSGSELSVDLISNSGLAVDSSGLSVAAGLAGDGLTLTSGVLSADFKKFATTIDGDGSTAAFAKTHSLGSRDVDVTVYESASPYAEVEVDIAHTSTTVVTVTFATAPANGTDYRLVVVG